MLAMKIWFFSSISMICCRVIPNCTFNDSDSLATGRSRGLSLSSSVLMRKRSFMPASTTLTLAVRMVVMVKMIITITLVVVKALDILLVLIDPRGRYGSATGGEPFPTKA